MPKYRDLFGVRVEMMWAYRFMMAAIGLYAVFGVLGASGGVPFYPFYVVSNLVFALMIFATTSVSLADHHVARLWIMELSHIRIT